jgi:vancomycin resistance protein VanJ
MPHRLPFSPKRLLRLSIWVYALGMVLFYLMLLTPLSQFWVFQAFNTFGVWLYLPLVFLVPLALLTWRKRAALLLCIPILGFVTEYHWCFLPQSTPSGRADLQVMTWNVRYDNPSPETIQQTILAEKPDVVALQELIVPIARPLGKLLKSQYPYQLLARESALGIYSRYPLQSLVLSTSADCRCQPVQLDLPVPDAAQTGTTRSVALINVHLPTPGFQKRRFGVVPVVTDFNTTKQDRYLQPLLEQIKTISQPLLVMGDFNIGDRQPNYRKIRTHLADTFAEVGWGFGLSYPVNRWTGFPVVRLDYVFHSRQWQPQSIWQGQAPGADHKYLVTRLNLAAVARN